ncbi:SAM-dependent methyltransferase [Rhodococcus sp. PAMC28707]|uniref:N-6 DNA methylase n=1 Tax=unclassified Rhodococcus (in: high G+C Gram-positive bacteria) TaxID=192944 RepID=UPI00109DECC0|nr:MULTISPECIES: N-6 DNA methylase [unclassified Rhodococcus (in: high G+C Gram-positive bacteria)]QCB51988.1 SAM-dependent methyltransferase [Rhodococcus sp. PAMC28705]QCB59843.1 SAM-dependent methyltransferase [Rhodococcus sp. PAMC28707]
MKFKSEQSYDKLRGGYYTPDHVARYLTRWALADGATSVLEPSCGDGAFLKAVVELDQPPATVHGVELDPSEAAKAQKVLGRPSKARKVFAMDFLSYAQMPGRSRYDAAVGNPPFIRYQFLEPETQILARDLYARHGLPFTKHLNAWAPFVVNSLDLTAPGGRIAMVIPAELLNVIHAGGLRLFLLQQCAKVLLIDPQELIFDAALQGTVLLMATKRSEETDGCGLAVEHEPTNDFLDRDPGARFDAARFIQTPPTTTKWMSSLLTAEEQETLARVRALPAVHRFDEVATVSVGIVTGANKFFLVPDSVVKEFDLYQYVKPMFGRSYHVPGVIYDTTTHAANTSKGLATNFLHFGSTTFDDLPSGAQRYIQKGEAEELHLRYKCRIRDPWYDVPSVRSATMSLLKRCHEAPRLISNTMNAYTTDTAYRVASEYPPEVLAVGFFNSLTALTAEMSGRAYGGGVLELVPSEIRSLAVPVIDIQPDVLRQLDRRFRDGDSVEQIFRAQDETVLGQAGVSSDDIRVIQNARLRLMNRRLREVTTA